MADMTGTYISSGELQGTIVSAGLLAGTIVGMRGPKGDKGDKGDTGNTGATGNGISSVLLNQDYTLTISFTDGTSYTTGSIRGAQGQQGEKGDTGSQGPQGIQGIQGETGAKGDTGLTPQLSVGSVTTLPAGSSVTVTITGTTDAPILNFGIPKGDPGKDGGVDVDDAISSTSFHPVQNRVIYNALQGKADTADIPTKTSDLTNDSGFLTQHQDISGKVDKVTGKGLSTNDYTTTEKDKLAGIAAGAEVNVQSDWNQSTSTADDYIKNKPAIPTKITDLTDDSDFVSEDVIADEYSSSSTYAVGDYCIYNGQFYRCTTAITTAEAWTAAHWTSVNVADELTDLKGDIPQNVSDLTNDSGYQTASQVATAVTAAKVLQVDIASFSSLPQTVTNSSITSDMVVVNSVLGTPSAQTGDWTVTTGTGTLTVSGSISGSTTLTLYLAESM